MAASAISLGNPLAKAPESVSSSDTQGGESVYDEALAESEELLSRPLRGGGEDRVRTQHSKGRMTVWERIRVLTEHEPNILWQNWGPGLDGASIVTGILNIGGRDVAVYGHDFTLRAGSMDATNGAKLARLIYMAGENGMPLIGMNDSAGAFVPAGVGGLDGYSEAFTALRKISGLAPSISLMFGHNAGGGAYLPRQGSFMIQCNETFIGLTGPGVVKSVLGEDVTADELGGPGVHGMSGVCDITTADELGSLRTALRLLSSCLRRAVSASCSACRSSAACSRLHWSYAASSASSFASSEACSVKCANTLSLSANFLSMNISDRCTSHRASSSRTCLADSWF